MDPVGCLLRKGDSVSPHVAYHSVKKNRSNSLITPISCVDAMQVDECGISLEGLLQTRTILFEIVSHLSLSDLLCMHVVNKQLHRFLQEEDMYKLLCLYAETDREILNIKDRTWKKTYIEILSGYSWDPKEIHPFLKLSNRNKTVSMSGSANRWVAVKTKPIAKTGIHKLHVRMDTCGDGGHSYVGICRQDFEVHDRGETGTVTKSSGRWTYASNGAISVDGQWIYSSRYASPSVVTILVDMDKREASFLVDGKQAVIDRGISQPITAKQGCPIKLALGDGPLCFVASMYYKSESMSILSSPEAEKAVQEAVQRDPFSQTRMKLQLAELGLEFDAFSALDVADRMPLL